MVYKAYNTWNNMVNRKQRSLDEQKRYLETWNKRLIEAKQKESEGKDTYIMGSKYWEKEVKATSRKIEKLEVAQQSVINLVSRVEDKVGKVTDWSEIHFGSNGMLNGRVNGTCGSTYVETIPAGGYNIQKFHYRVILKK